MSDKRKNWILAIAIIVAFITSSAFAGLLDTTITANADQEFTKTRPVQLKEQVAEMKVEVPVMFGCMVTNTKQKWGDDKDMVLWELKQQVDAYWTIRENSFPQDVVNKAFGKWGCDVDMALWEIEQQVEAGAELDSLLDF